MISSPFGTNVLSILINCLANSEPNQKCMSQKCLAYCRLVGRKLFVFALKKPQKIFFSEVFLLPKFRHFRVKYLTQTRLFYCKLTCLFPKRPQWDAKKLFFAFYRTADHLVGVSEYHQAKNDVCFSGIMEIDH